MRWLSLTILLIFIKLTFTSAGLETDEDNQELNHPIFSEFRSRGASVEIFGKTVHIPEWLNVIINEFKVLGHSMVASFTGESITTRHKIGRHRKPGNFLNRLKRDETARIRLVIYCNILLIIIVYLIVTLNLILISLKESREERRNRKRFSSHAAFESPDYNIPLASIATREARETTIENPDFVEMARDALDSQESEPVEIVEADVVNEEINDLCMDRSSERE